MVAGCSANPDGRWTTQQARQLAWSLPERPRPFRVGTIRRDCLDWLLIASRRQLECVLRVYVEHYNTHRPHRALGLRPPAPGHRLHLVGSNPPDQIQRRERLGGLIHEYARAA